ncbi:DUF6223 family protein [Nocardia grenadensis]|uniref:DUF6223 family protein n=1 Tax=Nocardia grenadensis TaxID=931537 RepID=UPI003D70F079
MSVQQLLVTSEILAQAAAAGPTAGRVWSLVGVAVGLTGVVLGVRTVIRRAGQRSAVIALVSGVVGLVVGLAVVLAAEGGPGTGYGIVGGFLALAIGSVAAVFGALALWRVRLSRGRREPGRVLIAGGSRRQATLPPHAAH